MRETIAYSKDYEKDLYFEQVKIKPEGFKNKVTALLYNERGELIKEEFTENIVQTKGLDLFLYVNTFAPIIQEFQGSRHGIGVFMPSRYLILTDYNGAENADNVLLRGKQCGYAYKSGSNVVPDSIKGYMNTVESQKISKYKFKYVFDFPQTCANGTFQSIWFGDHSYGPVQGVNKFITLPQPDSGNNYGAYIYEGDGYWAWTSGYLRKYKYDGLEDNSVAVDIKSIKMINEAGTPVFSYYDSNPKGRLLHRYPDGTFLAEFTYFSDRLFRIDIVAKTAATIMSPFNKILSSTIVNGNIYWLCNFKNNYCITKMPLSDFESRTTFVGAIPDEQYIQLLPILKTYFDYSSFTFSNPSEWSISKFEGKVWMSTYFGTGENKIVMFDPDTLQIVDGFSTFCPMFPVGFEFPNSSVSWPSTASESSCIIAKWLNSNTVLTSKNELCKVVPPISHAKLPSAITKDSSQSLKIIYEFEVLLPSDWIGTIPSRF